MRGHVIIDNELVHKYWACPLLDIRKEGVYFNVNEGRRTLARQQYFWGCYQCQCCNNGNLAARPTPWAPHIRVGRADHALDLDNAARVASEMEERGIDVHFNVPGESWHMEAVNGDRDIKAYWKKHCDKDKYDTLPSHVERAVRTFFGRRNNVRALLEDRNKIDSKMNEEEFKKRHKKVEKAVKARNRSRKKLERMRKRALSKRTKRILGQVLDQNPHND
jgi:hypothetical protein